MRTPSPTTELYAWWSRALNDPRTPRHEGEPHCGWYRTRLVKGGPWVAVEIICEREIDAETGELASDECLFAIVEGQKKNPLWLWTYLTPISRAEHETLKRSGETNPIMRATMARVDLSEKAMRP